MYSRTRGESKGSYEQLDEQLCEDDERVGGGRRKRRKYRLQTPERGTSEFDSESVERAPLTTVHVCRAIRYMRGVALSEV